MPTRRVPPTGRRLPALPAEEAHRREATAGGAALGAPQPLAPVTGHLQLQQLDLPPQHLLLLLATGHLQLDHRVAVVHNFADLSHGSVGQDLHNGGDMGVDVRHPYSELSGKNNNTTEAP